MENDKHEQKGKKILIIEDESHISEGLRFNLKLTGHDPKVAAHGIEAFKIMANWYPDLIVLDLMMPKMDGMAFLKELRKTDQMLPVIVLSAKFETKDKIQCFSSGVDDYLSKPFDLEEFLLRVNRLLERSSWIKLDPQTQSDSIYYFGENRVDFSKNEAFNGQEFLTLTLQEARLLKFFLTHPNQALERKDILEMCWGYDGDMSTRTLDNFIVRFRKYFEKDPKNPAHFKSLRSIGYQFLD